MQVSMAKGCALASVCPALSNVQRLVASPNALRRRGSGVLAYLRGWQVLRQRARGLVSTRYTRACDTLRVRVRVFLFYKKSVQLAQLINDISKDNQLDA